MSYRNLPTGFPSTRYDAWKTTDSRDQRDDLNDDADDEIVDRDPFWEDPPDIEVWEDR